MPVMFLLIIGVVELNAGSWFANYHYINKSCSILEIAMAQLTLMQKIRHLYKKEYIDLEIRSDSLKKKDLKKYVNNVIDSIESMHPQFSLIRMNYSKEIEKYRHLILAVYGIGFPGYQIRIAANIEPSQLKQTCIELEMDGNGNRISDIDIYLPDNTKISRKYQNLQNN